MTILIHCRGMCHTPHIFFCGVLDLLTLITPRLDTMAASVLIGIKGSGPGCMLEHGFLQGRLLGIGNRHDLDMATILTHANSDSVPV